MEKILALLPKPSRYLGIEEGSVHKKKEDVSLRLGLAFPDMYEIGMSYLGQKILYAIVNETPHWQAERVFTPCPEGGEILKKHQCPLCTLESKTPLAELDALGFAITHELSFTNILYMLDLAGIPRHSSARNSDEVAGKKWPIIMAGGGCTLAAEPVACFFDLMMLGDGEELLPELLFLLEDCQAKGLNRLEFLKKAKDISGVYVPEFFLENPATAQLDPLFPDYTKVSRRLVHDLDTVPYPARQPIPFGAVHNRLALEIARGCTRGCRFCQAGATYRPARERSVDNLTKLLKSCLSDTGFDEVSFLSLSTGDFSALKELFMKTVDYCAAEQVSVSLPSLRVGSIDDSIMERMAGIRRTGATLAPEAGSQRMRDVINKGITEEDILLHVQKLFEHGWQQVKLYFMIGLPTETDEDLQAIIDLCIKARDAAGPGIKRLQITASFSPFVPKAHTPFQWHQQDSLEEMRRKIGFLLNAIKGHKRIKLRWHQPEMSCLEGILSRGKRNLSAVVESAYEKGAIFSSWMDHFSLEPWIEAMAENGLRVEDYTRGIALDEDLPWDHLNSGLSKSFFKREWQRAIEEKTVKDCRYYACLDCGVCDTKTSKSLLEKPHRVICPGLAKTMLPLAQKELSLKGLEAEIKILSDEKSLSKIRESFIKSDYEYHNILNKNQRDQEAHKVKLDEYGRVMVRDFKKAGAPHSEGKPDEVKNQKKKSPPELPEHLSRKTANYKITYARSGAAAYLSQLEIQAIFERALRRGKMPLSFSQGFRPAPLFSFGRALSVGVCSRDEWLTVIMSEKLATNNILCCFKGLPLGMEVQKVGELDLKEKQADSKKDLYEISILDKKKLGEFFQTWQKISESTDIPWTRETKRKSLELNARDFFEEIKIQKDSVLLTLNWEENYVSPLALCLAALAALGYAIGSIDIKLEKIQSL